MHAAASISSDVRSVLTGGYDVGGRDRPRFDPRHRPNGVDVVTRVLRPHLVGGDGARHHAHGERAR
jgi:hypothetical protein